MVPGGASKSQGPKSGGFWAHTVALRRPFLFEQIQRRSLTPINIPRRRGTFRSFPGRKGNPAAVGVDLSGRNPTPEASCAEHWGRIFEVGNIHCRAMKLRVGIGSLSVRATFSS